MSTVIRYPTKLKRGVRNPQLRPLPPEVTRLVPAPVEIPEFPTATFVTAILEAMGREGRRDVRRVLDRLEDERPDDTNIRAAAWWLSVHPWGRT